MHDSIRARMFARWFEKKSEEYKPGSLEREMYTTLHELLTAFEDPEGVKRYLLTQVERLYTTKKWTGAQRLMAEMIIAELPGEGSEQLPHDITAQIRLPFIKEDDMKYALSIFQKNNPTARMHRPRIYYPHDLVLIRFYEEHVTLEYGGKEEKDA
jgi:hypothetical protein